MSTKTTAQLDREIAEVLAARATERRSPTTASGVARKLTGNAKRLISRQRKEGSLRDPERTLGKLSDFAAEAIAATELEMTTVRLPTGYEEIWVDPSPTRRLVSKRASPICARYRATRPATRAPPVNASGRTRARSSQRRSTTAQCSTRSSERCGASSRWRDDADRRRPFI